MLSERSKYGKNSAKTRVENRTICNNLEIEEITHIIKDIILERYRKYSRLIKYPGDWGERAFRAWLMYEVFHKLLEWPIKNIVFGEIYDVLLVDDMVRPVIYIETKKPEVNISKKYLKESIDRANHFFSIQYVLLTNGIHWYLYDTIKGTTDIISIGKSKSERIVSLFAKLHAKYYCEV